MKSIDTESMRSIDTESMRIDTESMGSHHPRDAIKSRQVDCTTTDSTTIDSTTTCGAPARGARHEARGVAMAAGGRPRGETAEEKRVRKAAVREAKAARRRGDDPLASSKPCGGCAEASDLLVRCQADSSGEWRMLCGACWAKASGGVVDGDTAHPHYRYGGLWKSKARRQGTLLPPELRDEIEYRQVDCTSTDSTSTDSTSTDCTTTDSTTTDCTTTHGAPKRQGLHIISRTKAPAPAGENSVAAEKLPPLLFVHGACHRWV
jgi:hypothetical protein